MTPSSGNAGGKVGLALGSGAAKGWAHIGVIRALEEEGIRPEIICGTSMGALVGAAYAADELDGFEEWGRGLEWRQMVSYFDFSMRGGLIHARKLFDFVREAFADQSIESLPRAFAAVGTDLATGQEIWMREGELIPAIRASVALPGLITPAKWQGRWVVDGGLVNPVPVSLCRALGADRVIAVDLNTTLLGRRLTGSAQESDDEPTAEPMAAISAAQQAEDIDGGIGQRLNAVLRDFTADLKDRFATDEDAAEDSPSIYEVMANCVNIMQLRIGRSRMAGDPPEMLVTPRMSDFSLIDFDRADEAIDEGRRAVARALAVETPQ